MEMEKKKKKNKRERLQGRINYLLEDNKSLEERVKENKQLEEQLSDLKLKLEEETNSGKKRKKKGDDDNPRKKRISLEKALSPPQRDIPAIPNNNNNNMLGLTENKNFQIKPLHILWDPKSVGFPKTWKTMKDFLSNLGSNFKRLGFHIHQVHVYDITFTREFWASPNLKQNEEIIPPSRKQKVRFREPKALVVKPNPMLVKHWVTRGEDMMIVDAMRYSLSKNPPVSLAVVSSDTKYLRLIERLRAKGVDSYLSCNYSSPLTSEMIKEKDYFIDWDFLTKIASGWSPVLQPYVSPLPRLQPPSTEDRFAMIAFWHVETPFLPFTTTVGELGYFSRVETFVQKQGHALHSLNCYYEDRLDPDPESAKANAETKKLIAALNSTDGIKVHSVYPIAKTAGQSTDAEGHSTDAEIEFLDKKIAIEMYMWTLTKMPPAPMLLISSDIRLASVVKELRAARFKVLVATDKKNREAWDAFNASGANCVFDWV